MKNFERLEYLIGKDKLQKTHQATVAIIGLGGVGSICALALARSGVGHLLIQDFDVVQESNINRQLIANYQTIGKLKTELVYHEIQLINPNCQVTVLNERFCEDSSLFSYHFDFLVDAIDSIPDKYYLIKKCLELNIKFISAMGAAKKVDLQKLSVLEIKKTAYDPIAKIIRKKLRNDHIEKPVIVVSSTESPHPMEGLGSYMPVTATAGLLLADYILKQIWKGIPE
ncbi:MAG: ThiF family adenylyltransferase [Bacilli bacterium]